MPKYRIDNVEDRHAENPNNFHIATLEERERVPVGAYVKLVFLGGDRGERMWVEVTQACIKGKYKGTLANHPFVLEGRLKWGDEIEFGPENVATIMVQENA